MSPVCMWPSVVLIRAMPLFLSLFLSCSSTHFIQFLSKGSAGSELKLSKTEEQGSAVTPGMEEEEETGRQLPRGRLQWFLMLDYR